MEPIELKDFTQHYSFNDYKNTPVNQLPLIAIQENPYSKKEFFNIRMDFLALLLKDIPSISLFSTKKNVLKGKMINENNHKIISSTYIYFPKEKESVEYEKDQEFISVKDFLFNNENFIKPFFSYLEKNPDFLQKLPEPYSNFLFSLLISKREGLFHIDGLFRPQELYSDVNNTYISKNDRIIRDMYISSEDREHKTFQKAKILLSYFNHLHNNKIIPTTKDKKYFKRFFTYFVGNYNYPQNLEPLYNYFNQDDFYSSPEVIKHFTLHFSKAYWDNYNKHHNIQPKTDQSFGKFSSLNLFIRDDSDVAEQKITQTLNFLATLSYNYSVFLRKNDNILNQIYKKLYQSINIVDDTNIIKKTVLDYYNQRTILLVNDKKQDDNLIYFLNLFNKMGFPLIFGYYSSFVTKKVLETKDLSILDSQPYLYLCENIDLKTQYRFENIRISSLSSLLYINDDRLLIDLLDRIKNNIYNFQEDQDSNNRSNSHLFNYVFQFYLNERENLNKSVLLKTEEILTHILRSITGLKDNKIIESLKKDKSVEDIIKINTQFERFKIKASLEKTEHKIGQNKRL